MPTAEETQGAVTDPETGRSADSVFAVWHDPTVYDLRKHGPPYLPDVKMARVASNRKALKDFVRPLVEKTSADAMTEMLVVLQHIRADLADLPMSVLAALVAFLRAESMVHQAHHWQARGPNYYADHQLFERLYNGVIEDVDKLAERMVGLGQTILAHPVLHAKHVSAVVQTFYEGAPPNPNPDANVLISLRAALRTLVLLKIVYATLEKNRLLTHGTDNLLQGIADKHEEHAYLLKQRSMQRTSSYDRRPVDSSDSPWKQG
jgi:starvation-inducible DNA-binding protein